MTTNTSIVAATAVSAIPLPPDANGQAKLKELLALTPTGWYGSEALAPGGIYYGLILVAAAEMGLMQDAIDYVKTQTRVSTATQDFLDLASMDYFGTRFPRIPGEADSSFHGRLLSNLLLEGATRNAVIHALNSNGTPVMKVVEPWNPLDTGGWGPGTYYPGLAGPASIVPTIFAGGTPTTYNQSVTLTGTVIQYSPVTIVPGVTVTEAPGAFVITVPAGGGVVNIPMPAFEGYGAWGDISLPYQAFVVVLRQPTAAPVQLPPYPPGNYAGFNVGGFTPVAGGYLGLPQTIFTAQDTYQDYLLSLSKTFGTIVWRVYTNTDLGQRANASGPATVLVNNPFVQSYPTGL